MPSHEIKLGRARRISAIGQHPATYAAISRHLPDTLIARASAKEIAAVIDALYACAQEAKAIAAHDIISEGYVWDSRTQRHRELAA